MVNCTTESTKCELNIIQLKGPQWFRGKQVLASNHRLSPLSGNAEDLAQYDLVC